MSGLSQGGWEYKATGGIEITSGEHADVYLAHFNLAQENNEEEDFVLDFGDRSGCNHNLRRVEATDATLGSSTISYRNLKKKFVA